jgi:hypothetical protein
MRNPRIDNVSAGYIFAYDAETGDVLWTHEKIVEVVRDREERPARVTETECEQVRAEAARVFRDRKVKALIAPQGFALGENMRISIDPQKKTLREEKEAHRDLADRFSDAGGKG